MRMEMCWTFLVLLLCRSSHLAWSSSTPISIDRIERVPSGGAVAVPCQRNASSSHTQEDVTFRLLKDGEVIRVTQTKSQTSGADGPPFVFRLAGLNASSCGVYTCQTVALFPPPFFVLATGENILLLVEVAESSPVCPTPKPDQGSECGFHWMWIVTAVCGIYGVIVTIVAIVIQVKMKNAECQNDYMNTKPKVSRDHRKKKRVQNPAPWYC